RDGHPPMREHGAVRRLSVLALALAFVTAVACSSDASSATGSSTPSVTFSLQVASSDLYTGPPQRVQVGVFNQSANGIQLLTGGSIPLSLAPADGGQPIQGTAHYVPAPGTAVSSKPALTSPSKARGVYELDHVTFPSVGVCTATLSFTSNAQPETLTSQFGVSDAPALPAPGQKA